MSTLSPIICAELATLSYQIKEISGLSGYKLQTSKALDSFFSFDLSKGPVKGISGGAMAHAMAAPSLACWSARNSQPPCR